MIVLAKLIKSPLHKTAYVMPQLKYTGTYQMDRYGNWMDAGGSLWSMRYLKDRKLEEAIKREEEKLKNRLEN